MYNQLVSHSPQTIKRARAGYTQPNMSVFMFPGYVNIFKDLLRKTRVGVSNYHRRSNWRVSEELRVDGVNDHLFPICHNAGGVVMSRHGGGSGGDFTAFQMT